MFLLIKMYNYLSMSFIFEVSILSNYLRNVVCETIFIKVRVVSLSHVEFRHSDWSSTVETILY